LPADLLPFTRGSPATFAWTVFDAGKSARRTLAAFEATASATAVATGNKQAQPAQPTYQSHPDFRAKRI
jgi:hypothetical protein